MNFHTNRLAKDRKNHNSVIHSRTIVARRICLLVGLHYLYRSVTFFVTVLPKPDASFHCAPQLNNTSVLVVLERFVTLASGFGLTINGNYVYCGDYIYSGHTTMLVSCYLIIQGSTLDKITQYCIPIEEITAY